MSLPYAVHSHAVDRIAARFKVRREHVTNWANQALINSVKAYTQEDGRVVYQHRLKEIFLVVDESSMLVVTTIDKPIERVKVRTQFLDTVAEELKEELVKMEREYQRKLSELDAEYAVTKQVQHKLGATKLKEIAPRRLDAEKSKLKAEFDISHAKISVFIRSITGEEV